MTYNGYLLPRFKVLSGNTSLAVACVGFVWALEHVFVPFTLDPRYMASRLLGALPNAVFQTLLYLRLRRLLPLAIAHAVLDGSTVWIDAISSLLRA
jgi:membrane protease YdiL (CAAX protease family)